MDVRVTTVARGESTIGQTPAAIFVVTQEMIHRSGATNIPEILRMVPGLEVGHIDSSKWGVSSRGFNTRFANKLLVQVDGRTVYTPINGGVYWDTVDYVLEDIERIEVVRGPGASVWGANAVNGIINIITKQAKDTQGVLWVAGGGTEERAFSSFRFGGAIGDNVHYRVYGKWLEHDNGFNLQGNAQDDWRDGRVGFRLDRKPRTDDNRELNSEELFAYELGWRAQATDMLSFDAALFFNRYDQLLVSQPGLPKVDSATQALVVPLNTTNGEDADTYGVEIAATWQITDWWRLFGQYTYLNMNLHADQKLPPGSRAGAELVEKQSPQNQFYIRSSLNLPGHVELD